MWFVKDYLEQNIREWNLNSTVLHNISDFDWEFEYDEFKTTNWGDSMLPPDKYFVKVWEQKQFPKFLAFHWWINLAKKIAYERYWDKWISNPKLWMEYADKILFDPANPPVQAKTTQEIKKELIKQAPAPAPEVTEEEQDQELIDQVFEAAQPENVDYSELKYSELQQVCKDKWIPANTWKDALLEALSLK